MEYDIHTLLDLATLATTIWVIYMIRYKLKSSYMEDLDNLPIYYVVSFCKIPLSFNLVPVLMVNHVLSETQYAFNMRIWFFYNVILFA